jgi:hypothetical protein
MNMKTVNCRSCGAKIAFIRTPRGKSHPVDATPRKVWIQVGDEWRLVSGYESHFATCPRADEHRKPRDTQGDLDL